MNLSIIMPVYNEVSTIEKIVSVVQSVPIEKEIIIVDDFSTDGTRQKLKAIGAQDGIQVLLHEKNQGKGAALRTGYAAAQNDIVIVQDADLEYDPREYPTIIAPILDGRADVVYGSRFIGGQSHRVLYFWHSIGNRFLTLLSNCLCDMNMTDMETCYKAFRRELIQSIDIQENRFGVEPEITAKVAAMGARIYEVGISYSGRTYAEGKKINWKDGLRAIWCVLKYNAQKRRWRKLYTPRWKGTKE
jgi:glycosyltransferase involved in cell wall biosynthesis